MKTRDIILLFTVILFITDCTQKPSAHKDKANVDSLTTVATNANGLQAQTVKDIDGNVYSTVTIGTQTWMAENLKTTKYRDGSAIPNITDNLTWINQTAGACCWYDNDIANKATYGALYNWYTVVDSRNLCPTGWHVPTDAEWTTLTDYLSGDTITGGEMKETGTTHWASPNTGATNESGFTALPGGCRYGDDGNYNTIGDYSKWWSAAENDASYAWYRSLTSSYSGIDRNWDYKRSGLSVRCLKDF
jgi:uncharacterized protein (TIGR02145 family)